MTNEEIIKAKTIKMCIIFKDLCPNYKYLTKEDFDLLEKYYIYLDSKRKKVYN